MKTILLVGEHPLSATGNGWMMDGILRQLDRTKYTPVVFGVESKPIDPSSIVKYPFSNSFIPTAEGANVWGHNNLVNTIQRLDFDILMMVGIDIWRYVEIFDHILTLKNQKKFTWVSLFPYDLEAVRKDWLRWINCVDVPCVYSQFGYRLLSPHVPNLYYFRPLFLSLSFFGPFDEQKKREARAQVLPGVKDDIFTFGFVGNNQWRKDPQRHIKAFSLIHKEYPKTALYMHTELNSGIFNLKQYARDCGLETGSLLSKPEQGIFSPELMNGIYNAVDAYVMCSAQEGLSITPLEAMLSKCPAIVSDTTSHRELMGRQVPMVKCTETGYIPLSTSGGPSYVEAKFPKAEDIAKLMERVMLDDDLRTRMIWMQNARAEKWKSKVDNINNLFSDILKKEAYIKAHHHTEEAVLFVQKSSAGDVLMTTRCLKGIRERYKLPLHYMTSPQYEDILRGNPLIDKIVPWDEQEQGKYKFVLNPHGEVILPGHWGRNSNAILSDFYWKILMVKPDNFFIEKKVPEDRSIYNAVCSIKESEEKIVVLHTTGGDPHHRTYKFMELIVPWLQVQGFVTIQMGGEKDYPIQGVDLDLRGRLNFRESAWVMSKAHLAVTVDSFMSHLAGALGVSQVCLFGCGNAHVVRPKQTSGKLICMVPNYIFDCKGLGPCSHAVRDCPAPCTGRHNPRDVIENICLLIGEGWVYPRTKIGPEVQFQFKERINENE